jgi:general secretion pathway protein F
MRYEVRAAAHGTVTSLIVEAMNEADARRELASRSVDVLSIRPLRGIRDSLSLSGSKPFPVDFFVEELSTLLEAGLSVVEALEATCEKDRNPRSRNVLAAILRGVHEGKRLSSAMEVLPQELPALLIAIVRAGERTGTLAESLRRYASYRARVNGVRAKITSASVYPAILLAAGTLVTLFLLGYVVPRFATVYQGSGQNLPWLSRVMLDWGMVVSANTTLVMASIGLTLLAMIGTFRHLAKRYGVGVVLNAIPAIQARVAQFDLIRLYMTTGMLIESGMPMVQALNLTRGALSPDFQQRLSLATCQIERGDSVTEAFEAQGLVTPVGLRLLSAGEGSGQMGSMMLRAADYHDAELTRWIDRFTRSFEPLLMAAIGLVIGTVVVLLYLPIFDLAGDLNS